MEMTLGATSVGGRGPATSTSRQFVRLGVSGSAWRPPRLIPGVAAPSWDVTGVTAR